MSLFKPDQIGRFDLFDPQCCSVSFTPERGLFRCCDNDAIEGEWYCADCLPTVYQRTNRNGDIVS